MRALFGGSVSQWKKQEKSVQTSETSSATAEIDDGPCGASTLSSWRSESSNISLVILDKLLSKFHLLEKGIKQYRPGIRRQKSFKGKCIAF